MNNKLDSAAGPALAPVPGPDRSRREQRRAQHQELSRTQLLDAAEEIFGRKGFHETTLKEVAELAEFAVGSVYSFFENKDDLFRQIFIRRGEEFVVGSAAVLEGDGPALPQLHALVDFEIGFFRAHPHFGRLYLRSSSAIMLSEDRRVDGAIAERYESTMAQQADLFRRGQRSGEFCAGDPDVLARLFSGLISAYQALDPAVMSDDTEVAERLALTEFHLLVERAFTS